MHEYGFAAARHQAIEQHNVQSQTSNNRTNGAVEGKLGSVSLSELPAGLLQYAFLGVELFAKELPIGGSSNALHALDCNEPMVLKRSAAEERQYLEDCTSRQTATTLASGHRAGRCFAFSNPKQLMGLPIPEITRGASPVHRDPQNCLEGPEKTVTKI